MDYIIREMNQADDPLLREFLYEAIFLPEGAARPPKSVVDRPELRVYTADFGDQADDMPIWPRQTDKPSGRFGSGS